MIRRNAKQRHCDPVWRILTIPTSPVGMFTCDPSGRIAYANKAWYQILGHPGNDDSKESWLACFEGKEIDNINSHFLQLITTHDPTTFEISLKRQWNKQLTSGETVRTAAWILVSAYVEILEDGSLSGARCSVTDISELKWAEEIQRNRMEEAIVGFPKCVPSRSLD